MESFQSKIDFLSEFVEKVKYHGIDLFLREHYNIPPSNELRLIEIWKENTHIYQKFKRSLSKVAKIIGLADRYIDWLEDLILLNLSIAPVHKIDSKFIYNGSTGEKELWMRIYSDTRQEDVATQWGEVVLPKQKGLATYIERNDRSADLELMKFVHDSKEKGIKNSEINETLIKWKGMKLNSNEIAKFKYRYKKKIQITDFDLKSIL